MELPERKSHKLERSILEFKEDLKELQSKHHAISEDILNLSSELLVNPLEEKLETVETLEDLNYELRHDILVNIEMTFESIGGFEIRLTDIDKYLPYIKDEQDLLNAMEISVKNLVKTASVKDVTLTNQEKENLRYLYNSYKKATNKTQNKLGEICEELEKMFQKVKKMEYI